KDGLHACVGTQASVSLRRLDTWAVVSTHALPTDRQRGQRPAYQFAFDGDRILTDRGEVVVRAGHSLTLVHDFGLIDHCTALAWQADGSALFATQDRGLLRLQLDSLDIVPLGVDGRLRRLVPHPSGPCVAADDLGNIVMLEATHVAPA